MHTFWQALPVRTSPGELAGMSWVLEDTFNNAMFADLIESLYFVSALEELWEPPHFTRKVKANSLHGTLVQALLRILTIAA
jgi:hypothetical protein